MTAEQLLYSAVVSVVGALVFCVRLLFVRADQCEASRLAMQGELNSLLRDMGRMRGEYGEMRGQLVVYKACPNGDCPFDETPPLGSRIPTPIPKGHNGI